MYIINTLLTYEKIKHSEKEKNIWIFPQNKCQDAYYLEMYMALDGKKKCF